MITSAKHFMTPPETAKVLGVDACKVLDWIHSGELEAANLVTVRGRRPRWRISLEALNKFLVARTSLPPAKAPRRKARNLEACAS